MIDAFLTVLEKLVTLAREKKAIEEQALAKLVEPTFTNLRTIHDDYVSLLEECQTGVSENKDLKALERKLHAGRLQFESLRAQTRIAAECYSQQRRYPRHAAFFESVSHYFSGATHETGKSVTAGFLDYLRHLNREFEQYGRHPPGFAENRKRQKKILEQDIEECLKQLRENWKNVSASYAALLADSALH